MRIYDYGLQDELNLLFMQCKILQMNCAAQIIASDYFIFLPLEMIIAFISQDNIDIKEELIFQQCVKWSQYQASKKQQSNQTTTSLSLTYSPSFIDTNEQTNTNWEEYIRLVIEYIRFPLMDMKYFVNNVCSMKN
ncbi:hypothetical protein RFI_29632, partial [Reticulomyxa filosa]